LNIAIVLAGGQGERMGGTHVPKQFIEVGGKPIIFYTLESIERNSNFDAACIVAPLNWHDTIRVWCSENGFSKVKFYAASGVDRQKSVHNGLSELKDSEVENVMIMTAVCPFVSQATINDHFDKLASHKGCITVVKAVDAITYSNSGVQADRTLQKQKMFVQQGPQTYKFDLILMAHEGYEASTYHSEVNEDSELILNMGVDVAMVLGDRFCLKVTYPEDVAIVEALKPLFEEKERCLHLN